MHPDPAQRTRRSVLARAGLAAGGVGAAVLYRAAPSRAQTVADTMNITPPAGSQALRVLPTGAVATSVSVGGALNLDNSGSTGAGAVLYSNRGADAAGRLLVVNQDNPANPQHALRIENSGVAHSVSIYHDPAGGAGDSTAEAVDVVSTNPLDTTLGVHGREAGRGTIKVTHEKPDSGSDAGASAISVCLLGDGTQSQGIYIGNDAGVQTTGALLNIRNGGPGTDRLRLTADGRLELPVSGQSGGILFGSDSPIYRSAPQMLTTRGTFEMRSALVHSNVTLSAKAANPSPPLAGSARLYVKDAKLVVQWTDGIQTLYTSIELDSPGPYPAAPVVTTDVSPP
jgi:hypothetical protein